MTGQIMPGITSTHIPHVICKDGCKMSVQAGQSLYSKSRDVAYSYEVAEVGYQIRTRKIAYILCRGFRSLLVVRFMDMYHVQLLVK